MKHEPTLRIDSLDLSQIAGYRYGFMIADMVLKDTLDEYAQGCIDEDELRVAIDQQRAAYEGYVRKLHDSLTPVAQA